MNFLRENLFESLSKCIEWLDQIIKQLETEFQFKLFGYFSYECCIAKKFEKAIYQEFLVEKSTLILKFASSTDWIIKLRQGVNFQYALHWQYDGQLIVWNANKMPRHVAHTSVNQRNERWKSLKLMIFLIICLLSWRSPLHISRDIEMSKKKEKEKKMYAGSL